MPEAHKFCEHNRDNSRDVETTTASEQESTWRTRRNLASGAPKSLIRGESGQSHRGYHTLYESGYSIVCSSLFLIATWWKTIVMCPSLWPICRQLDGDCIWFCCLDVHSTIRVCHYWPGRASMRYEDRIARVELFHPVSSDRMWWLQGRPRERETQLTMRRQLVIASPIKFILNLVTDLLLADVGRTSTVCHQIELNWSICGNVCSAESNAWGRRKKGKVGHRRPTILLIGLMPASRL